MGGAWRLAVVVLAVVLAASGAPSEAQRGRGTALAAPMPLDTDQTPLTDRATAELFELINAERNAASLPALVRATDPETVALMRVTDMAARHYLAHTSPEGLDARQLLAAIGDDARLVGENIGRSTYPAELVVPEVHARWMASIAHRFNVLHAAFRRVGIGIVSDGVQFYLAVIFTD